MCMPCAMLGFQAHFEILENSSVQRFYAGKLQSAGTQNGIIQPAEQIVLQSEHKGPPYLTLGQH